MNAPKNLAWKSTSVDEKERAKFDQFAKTWWDAAGPMWPLHNLNRFRIGFITEVLHTHWRNEHKTLTGLQELSVLDIGCGGGILSETMAKLGCVVHGVDISERNIEVARKHAQLNNLSIQYEVNTAESLAAQSRQYDVVLNMEVVEHVADLNVFMRACNALVAKQGLQIVSTINRNPLAWFIAVFGAEYVLGWLPKGTHQYRKLVKPRELIGRLNQDGLKVVARTGVSVNPLTRQMSECKSEKINYMVAAGRS